MSTRNLLLRLGVLVGLACVNAAGSGQIPESAQQICPLLTGSKIPAVTLKTIKGGDFKLVDAVATKPAILVFYRGGW